MSRKGEPGSFEDFLAWWGDTVSRARDGAFEPGPEVSEAAREARQEFRDLQDMHQEELRIRLRGGNYYEEVELLAAADADTRRWLPRLRTPNGFAISALYAPDSPAGSAPVGLLVECPVELIEVCRGQPVHVAAGGQWIELGEIDIDGKAIGDLPPGCELKPPFGFRVGKFEEEPTELGKPDETK